MRRPQSDRPSLQIYGDCLESRRWGVLVVRTECDRCGWRERPCNAVVCDDNAVSRPYVLCATRKSYEVITVLDSKIRTVFDLCPMWKVSVLGKSCRVRSRAAKARTT